jgi:hypothetical protein
MAKYMACICGWVSEPYPDNYMFMGLGGVLDCPLCRAQLRNATLEGCYGHVTTINSEELADFRKQESQGIEWEVAFRNLTRKRILDSSKPVLLTTPFNTVPPDQDWRMTEIEEDEDKLRKRKHKSIRVQGKYKGRGKTKRREP